MGSVDAPIGSRDGFDPEAFLQGPSPFVFELEDALQIDTLNSAAGVVLAVSGVMLGSDLQIKTFAFTHTPNTNRTLNTTRQHIGSGWLLRVRVIASSGTPLVGQCFAWLRLCRGLTASALINGLVASGYVTASKDIAYPGSQPTNPLDEAGAPLAITVSNPAAGTNWVQAVPTGARWKIVALAAQLQTSVAAGNRLVRLMIDDGATPLFEMSNPAPQAASLAVLYNYGAGAGGPVTTDAAVIEAPIPNDVYLPAGFRIRPTTGALDAADQWSQIRLLVQEWLEGN